jgi:hypothetical protein
MALESAKSADVPAASQDAAVDEPEAPPPASVETVAVAMATARMRPVFVSATKSVDSSALTARPAGAEKSAAEPAPSAQPAVVPPAPPPPASVVTAADAMSTARSTLLPLSATSSEPMAPDDTQTMLRGAEKVALVPAPLA